MKKLWILSLLTIILTCAGGYVVYKTLIPEVIADAVTTEKLAGFIPKRLKARVEAISKPINKGTEAFIEKMHASQIPVDEVLDAVDNISEEQIHAFLDEINTTKPKDTNEVFDVAKRHFRTKFDPEVFRQPFNEHFEMKQIANACAYANLNRKSYDIDIETAKAIVKKIIVGKDKEFRP